MSEPLTMSKLQNYLTEAGKSPLDHGKVEMIVCRPNHNERQVLERAELHLDEGLVGDNWRVRGSRHTDDGSAHPGMQIAIMNSRVIQAIAQERDRWSLAGDQLFVDLDLSVENLPPGQQLAIGTAILEITSTPHHGCKKFTERYGHEAIRLVNSPEGRKLRLRGVYARVIQSGAICAGDMVAKVKL